TARRRGGVSEGLGASRESGRNRNQDREGLGPVRRGRPGQRGGQNRPGGGGQGNRPGAPRSRGASRPAGAGGGGGGGSSPRSRSEQPQDGTRVEKPRTDDRGVSAEGRKQPSLEPQVETTPAPVADAPDSTTTKKQHEEPQKLDKSGAKGEHGGSGNDPGSGSKGSKGGRS